MWKQKLWGVVKPNKGMWAIGNGREKKKKKDKQRTDKVLNILSDYLLVSLYWWWGMISYYLSINKVVCV